MSIEEQIIDWIALRAGCRNTRDFYRHAEQSLATLLDSTGHKNLESLWKELDELGKASDAWLTTLGHCLNHESSFLLSPKQYSLIGDKPLSRLLKRNEGTKTLQVWCAGSGFGLEAFAIAMFLETSIQNAERWTIEILATDISPVNIARAKERIFEPDSLPDDFPEDWREAFLEESETGLRLLPTLKSKIEFKAVNLADNLSAIPICDIVLIRNVLPDMNDETRLHLGTQLLNHLHPDSLVVLDESSQAPGETGLLKTIASRERTLPTQP